MTYYLDTNICIYFISGKYPKITEKLKNIEPQDIKIPSIVAAELWYGVYKSKEVEKNAYKIEVFLNQFEIIPFTQMHARAYGDIRAELEAKGQIIGPNDMLIASIAKSDNAILVTHNISEFERIKGLEIDDWF